LTTSLLIAASIPLLTVSLRATEWTPITDSLLKRATAQDEKKIWPGGCAGVAANRLTGDVNVKVVGHGLWRSADQGKTWTEVSKLKPLTRIPVFFKGVHYLGTTEGLLMSKDKGSSWQLQGSPVDIWQGPFFGRDQQEILVVGESGIYQTRDAGVTWRRVADLKPNADGFKFAADWSGCYAWDPVNNIVYASSMGNPVFKLALGK
jgi:photosystem II stability/assembly factor-like uncharacterized protein